MNSFYFFFTSNTCTETYIYTCNMWNKIDQKSFWIRPLNNIHLHCLIELCLLWILWLSNGNSSWTSILIWQEHIKQYIDKVLHCEWTRILDSRFGLSLSKEDVFGRGRNRAMRTCKDQNECHLSIGSSLLLFILGFFCEIAAEKHPLIFILHV